MHSHKASRRTDRRFAWLLFLASLACSLGPWEDACAQSAVPLDQLRQKLADGWAHLRELDQRSKRYEVADDKKDPGKQQVVSSRRVTIDAEGWLVEGATPEMSYACARNPDYSFAAVKPSGKDWKIQGLAKHQSGPDALEQKLLFEGSPNVFFLWPLSSTFRSTSLPELSRDREFHLVGAQDLPGGKLGLRFQWAFVFDMGQDRAPKRVSCDGEMVVNPEASYGVEEWNCSLKGFASGAVPVRMTWEFGRDADGEVVCRSIKEEYPNIRHHFIAFDKYEKGPFSKDAFRLTAYGLPEPAVAASGRRVPRFIWMLAAGLGALLVAILLARLSARIRAKDAAERCRA